MSRDAQVYTWYEMVELTKSAKEVGGGKGSWRLCIFFVDVCASSHGHHQVFSAGLYLCSILGASPDICHGMYDLRL
jgi:hypothetical protein